MSVYSVNVYPSCITLKTGDWYYGAWADVRASSNCCSDVHWYSENPNIASVGYTNGYIHANSSGTVRIYAVSDTDSSKKDYITVNVTSGTICVDSITLNRTGLYLEKGDRFNLTATVCPTNATNKSISWRSTNSSVASVSGGNVTAKSEGWAYIYAEAQDGSGEYAVCYVNVTENVLVSSVTIDPPCLTLNVGGSECLGEIVCPANADNKGVRWSSDRPNVVTVNPDTGLVMAHSAGTAIITATACDGSGKKGTCTVSVNAPVPVTGIEVCPASKTMNVGDTDYLCATVYPYNATDKSVIWCSSNENVAEVGMRSGHITAKQAGTATITATTVDGEYRDSMNLTVIIDTVIIQKDGAYNKVVFQKSGKVWRCINQDMIFSDIPISSTLYDKSHLNFYGHTEYQTNIITYTDNEIKLLYAIDPYGVANYVQRYADEIFMNTVKEENIEESLRASISYKDYIFKMLFKRDPKYFARTIDGVWYEVTEYDEINDVLSESEAYFGTHPIYDLHTFFELMGVCSSILNIVFMTTFFTSSVAGIVLKKVVTTGMLVLSGIESILREEYASYDLGDFIESTINNTLPDWAVNYVSLYESLEDLVEAMTLNFNYNKEIIDYCACQTGYNVLFEMKDGTTYNLKEVCDRLD